MAATSSCRVGSHTPAYRSEWATGHVRRSSSQIGYGSAAHTSSVWSKSVAQSRTGGCPVVMRTAGPSRLLEDDRVLGTVGGRLPGVVLVRDGHRAVADLPAVAEIVGRHERGSQRVAAAVALAPFGID